jgi:N-acetylmuramoyl-L-alanine amidase
MLAVPAAGAAVVEVDGVPLTGEQGWVSDGVSYITLRALAELGGYDLSWDGKRARLAGEGLELSAAPGAIWLEVNDRALYVRDGVGSREGRSYLPLSVVADATGGSLRWDADTATARLYLENAAAPAADYDAETLYWLSRIISAESRGEPLLGQIAVGNVVLNRVAHKNYPDSVKEVVFDRNYGIQFEPVENGSVYLEPVPASVLAAKLCLEGASVVADSLYFYAPALSAGTWIVENGKYHTTIGCHRFYREI